MKRRWLRLTLLIPAAVIIILLLLCIGLLHAPPVQRFAFRQLHSVLLKKSAVDVRASGFRVNLFRGEVTLDGLSVRSASAPNLPPIFQANRVYLKADLLKIARGFWDLEELRIASPKIHYFVGLDGKTNLPVTPSSSGRAPDYLIARGEIRDGSLRYEDLRKKAALILPRWQLLLEGRPGTHEHKLDFSTLRNSSFEYGTYSIPIEQVKLSATLQRTALQVENASLSAAGSRLSVKGSINDFASPVVSLQLNPTLDLKALAQAAHSARLLNGTLAGTIQADGKFKDLKIDARIRGTNVTAIGYRNTDFDLKSRAEWTSGRILLSGIEFDSPQGKVRGNVELFTEPGPRNNSIEVKLRDFNLSPVWELLHPPFDLASRTTGDVSLRWKGPFSPSKFAGSARLNLAATSTVPGRYILPLSGTVDARLQPGQISGDLQSLTAFGVQLSGTFSLRSFREIGADIHGNSPEMDILISQISHFLGGSDNPLDGMRISGPLQFDAQVSGIISRPTVAFAGEAPRMQSGILKHLSTRIEAALHGSQITYQSAVTLPHSSTITAQGTFELGGSEPTMTLDAQSDHIAANAVTAMFDCTVPVAGDLKAELHMNGPLNNILGNASISGDALAIYGEPLGHLDMGVNLTGNELQSTQFRLLRDSKNPDSDRLDADFAYSFDTEQFKFQANGKELKLMHVILPHEIPVQAALNITSSGSGTVDQPSIDVKIEAKDLQLRQSSMGPISLTAALRNERITIEAAVPRLNLTSTAHIVDETPYEFDGEMRIGNSDLSLLGLMVGNKQPLTGALDANLRGSGNLNDFAQAHFSAEIRTLQLKAGDRELHIQAPVHAEYREDSLEISSPATLVSGKSTLELSGKVPLRQQAPSGSLTLKGQIDLAQATGFISTPAGFAASGTLNLNLSLDGTPKNLAGSGTITMNDGTATLPGVLVPLTGIVIRANVQGDSLILQQADAAWGQGRIALTGELPFGLLPKNIPVQFPRKEGPLRFSLDMTDLRPEATGRLPKGVSGVVSLHAAGQADSADLRSLKAQIDFSELGFRMNEIALDQKQSSTILIHDGIASVSRMSFSGTETSIEITGSAGLLPNGPLNLRLNGNLNAALLTFMNRDLKLSGRAKVGIAVAGNRSAPDLSGLAEMTGGKLTLRNPRVVADSLTVRLALDPEQISIKEFRGTLNGGPLTVTGTVGYGRGGLNDLNLTATVQDFFINFPEGLKSSSSGTLTITSSDETVLVSGNVRVQESSYREPFVVGSQLMSYLKGQQVMVAAPESDVLLNRIRLNIALRTETPLLVQNNIAKVEGTANVRLVGPFNDPSMVGRVTLNEGGEILLNERTYYINRGVITLTNEAQIEPHLDIEAQTKVGDYDITLQLTGTPDRLSTTLTSEPSLSEPDILSVLLTGKTTSETQGREFQMARTQALALIAGQAGAELTGEARRALHLSTFRIDPGLISSESDPGARLTLGEDVTKNLSLVYSMNLTNGGDQIWAAEYEIVRRLTTQATKQQDNTYRFEFHHDLLFGGQATTRRTTTKSQKFEIGSIRLEGGSPFPDKTLLDNFGVKPGQKYDFPKVQKGLDRLREFYVREKHLEADIRMHRETQDKTVDLNLAIEPGPVVAFSFEGTLIPSSVKDEVQKTWANGVFDVERIEDAVQAIRMPLLRAGFLQSTVTNKIETENGQKIVHFYITSGEQYANIPIIFPGASEIKAAQLSNAVEVANLSLDVYADPQKVVDYLSQYYRDRGYLQARVGLPSPQLDPKTRTGTVSIQIHEGPQFTIGDLEFSGNHAFGYDDLWSVIPTSSGSSYDPNTLRDAVKALENTYRSRGYNDVSVTYRVVQDSPAAHANLTFFITERKQSLIRDIVIEGTYGTSQEFVRRQLDFQAGDPLDYSKINETRKRLYSTAVYSSVDFRTEELPARSPEAQTKDVRISVRVREIKPYRLQYGLFYDTERGVGGILQAEDRNFLGRASNLGVSLRYDTDLKEGRLYLNQPFVTKLHLKMDASAFVQSETRPAFSANRVGFSLFQERSIPRNFRLDYGYRYDHVRWDGLPPDPTIFQASVPVARLVVTLTRDSRDSVLDATRGEFSSHSLEFGPRIVGSEIGFTRYYGQYFRYVPLDKFLWKPKKEKKTASTRLVYAGALRLGLTSAFGGTEVISPERFFAGGGTTMRGFEQDKLGPLVTLSDGTTRPTGGEALLLFNNELRFPIFGILHGVAFLDVGNVYPRVSDFNFNIRKSAGAGLRVKIKFIPLRFDYGLKLDRRPGESRGAFFFSIGQAF